MPLDREKIEQMNQIRSGIRRSAVSQGEANLPPIQESISRIRGEESPTFIERAREDITKRGETIAEAVRGEGEFEDASLLRRGTGATAEAFSAISSTAYEALPEKARNVLDRVGGGIGKGFNFLVDKISDSPFLQEAMSGDPEDTKKLTDALQIVSDLGLIAGEVAGLGETAAAANIAQKATSKAIKTGVKVGKNKFAKATLPVKTKTDELRNKFKPAETLPEQQAELVKSYTDNVIGDNVTVNKKLNSLAERNRKTKDELLTELIEEGGIPEVKGNKTDFTSFRESINRENKSISDVINKRVSQLKNEYDLDNIEKLAQQNVLGARATTGELTQMQDRISKIIQNYRKKHGNTLNDSQINELRVEMNKKFKDAKPFEVDANRALGDTARKLLDDADPEISEALAHQSKLNRVLDTSDALDLKKIGVNEYVEKMGGFAGTMLAGGLGISALAGGPAGLLIAGMAANIGSKVLSRVLRKRLFSKDRLNLIKLSLDENPDILKSLLDKADKVDRGILQEQLLLPEPKTGDVQRQIDVPLELPTRRVPDEPQAEIIVN